MSALSSFKLFDLVKNVAIDGMYGIYGGITKMLLGLWLDTKHHKMPWYCGLKVKQIDSKLVSICPPSNITKTPRSLTERNFWKSTSKINTLSK